MAPACQHCSKNTNHIIINSRKKLIKNTIFHINQATVIIFRFLLPSIREKKSIKSGTKGASLVQYIVLVDSQKAFTLDKSKAKIFLRL